MSPFIRIFKCPRCNQPVYAAEEVIAGGRRYHKICFKCGLCRKTLNSTNLAEHEGNIYCKQCYSRLYGPRGVGFGTGAGSLSMDRGENFKMRQALIENYQEGGNANYAIRYQVPASPTYSPDTVRMTTYSPDFTVNTASIPQPRPNPAVSVKVLTNDKSDSSEHATPQNQEIRYTSVSNIRRPSRG